MRLVTPSASWVGLPLARQVCDEGGQVLCGQGTRLTASLVAQLQRRGIDVIYVEEPGFEGIAAEEGVPWPVREGMRRLMAAACQAAADGRWEGLDPAPLWALRDRFMAAVPAQPWLLWPRRGLVFADEGGVRLAAAQADMAEALAVHTLNTALIVAAAAGAMRLGGADHMALVAAALLHDVGMCQLPPAAWRREGPLEAAEREVLRHHPEASLAAFPGSHRWDTYLRLAVRQHHERLDGSGYPQGIAGARLHPASALLAAADVYAALWAPRPHRCAWRPEDIVARLQACAGQALPADAVRAVVSSVGLYPPGAVVRLSDGRRGVVVQPGRGAGTRPVLRVGGADLDLNAQPGVAILGVVG